MKPVWIIDDDKSIRWVIEKALSREGIVFKSFSTAQEGMDALDAGEPDEPQVVISDIRMPGASGLDFMQRLKTKLLTRTWKAQLPHSKGARLNICRSRLTLITRSSLFGAPSTKADAKRRKMKPPLRHPKYSVQRRRCRKFFAPSDGFRKVTPP